MKTSTTVIAIALLVSSLAAPRLYAQAPADNQSPNLTAQGPGDGPDRSGVPTDSPGVDSPGVDSPGVDSPGADSPEAGRPGYGRPGKSKRHPDGPAKHQGPGQHQGPGRGMGDRQPGDRPAGRGRGGLTSLTTVSGTVGQWTGNDDMILDGFTLTGSSSTSATTVKFPAHLGQQIQKAVKPGSSVSVTGYTNKGRDGESRFNMTSLTAGKTTVFDTPAVRPAPPTDAPAMVTETGKIADYRLDRGGRVNGLVLDNKTVIQVPPHVVAQLTTLATKGVAITVQGYPKILRDGQVQLTKTNILRASVLTINGQQYLVR